MANAREDILAIEAATELLVRGLNRSDISSISDLVTDTTLVMPAGRRVSRGSAVVDSWRNLAMGQEGFAVMSTHMDTIADGVMRDMGSLSMRARRSGERMKFRYITLWHKVGTEWKLATLSWNREPVAGGARQGGQRSDGGGGAATGEM